MKSRGQGRPFYVLFIVAARDRVRRGPGAGSHRRLAAGEDTKQAKLISSGKVKVEASADDAQKTKLSVSILQDGDRTKVTKATRRLADRQAEDVHAES